MDEPPAVEQLRIIAHNGAPEWGGAEIQLCALLAGLAGRGHAVTLFYNREVVGKRARALGLETRRVHIGGDIAVHHAAELAWILRADPPDAFIVGTFRKLLHAATGANLAGVPQVVAQSGRSTDVPRNVKYRMVFKKLIDRVVTASDDIRDDYRQALPDMPPNWAVTVYEGIQAPPRKSRRGAMRDALGISADAPVVGAIAHLTSRMRLDRLLNLMPILRDDAHCVIAGDGEDRPDLERLAKKLEVQERVHFLGHRDDVGDVLDGLDVHVTCSDREAMANTMLEAMASGVPVITTPVAGAAEALYTGSDGTTPGIMLDSFEAPDLERAVRRLLNDPEERRAMGEAGVQRVKERFGVERMLDQWESVLAGSADR